jgi:acylphosphatase
MIKGLSIRVTGKVQGVFFRASTQQKAKEFGIAGFVRNEPDGSVYIEAEGDDEKLRAFQQWCHNGPPGAKVENVRVKEKEVTGFSGFEVRR